MPRPELDHIIVAAPSLGPGIDFVQRTLGVSPQAGGEHVAMGTHNALLRLGESAYLEVIAPNPNAARPPRPRWFGLDELRPDAPPRLLTWAVRTSDIRATVAAATEPLGNVEPMSRGNLSWLISIPPDGRLVFDGIAPTVIEWPRDVQVASKLDDVGCSLVKLEGFHPQAARLSGLLKSMSVGANAISLSSLQGGRAPYLVASIQTPNGLVKLSAA